MLFQVFIKSARNSLILNCPTSPFKPKSQILFDKKRQMKDFLKYTLKGETENGKGKIRTTWGSGGWGC